MCGLSDPKVELTKAIAETASIPQWQAAQAASFLIEEGWRPPLPAPEGPSPWDAYVAAYRAYQETDPHGATAHPTAHHMHALEAALRVAGLPLPDSETERPRRCPALTPESDLITAGRQCQQYEGHVHDHTWYGDNGYAYSAWRVTS